MNQESIVLYGQTTISDLEFMESYSLSFPSTSSADSLCSTMSDAESAPPELDRVFDRICSEYAEWVVKAGKELPPQWDMPSLVRAVIGDEGINIPGFLTDSYYDVVLHGSNSWVFQEVLNWISLINYAL